MGDTKLIKVRRDSTGFIESAIVETVDTRHVKIEEVEDPLVQRVHDLERALENHNTALRLLASRPKPEPDPHDISLRERRLRAREAARVEDRRIWRTVNAASPIYGQAARRETRRMLALRVGS